MRHPTRSSTATMLLRHALGDRRNRPSSGIAWYQSRESWASASEWISIRERDEAELLRPRVVRGRCDFCSTRSTFAVDTARPANLRESLACRRCKLINRVRLLYRAMVESDATPAAGPFYLLERFSELHARLEARFGRFTASEYVPDAGTSGAVASIHRQSVVHQDLHETSFENSSFASVVHAEVLEHVADYKTAIGELFRILRPGGVTVFTVPFMETQASHLFRAVVDPEGRIRHVLSPEVHGNPIDPGGSLVFQIFGWDLLGDVRAAGFETCEAGFLSDTASAITNGVVFRARKGGSR